MKPYSSLAKIIKLIFQRGVNKHTQANLVIHLQGYEVANRTHLSELQKLAKQKRGYKIWNQWRRENPTVTPNLSRADLSELNLGLFDLRGANLKSAVLRNTQLSWAKLNNADLSNANLSRANLNSAELISCNLNKANLSRAELCNANLRKACFITASLREANLSNATLSFATLTQTRLNKADLTSAVMRSVDLQDADLSAVQALGADFEGAVLTGVCIQDWNVNHKTVLNDVRCDYVYMGKLLDGQFSHCLPNDRTFAPGEFTKRFRAVSRTDAIEVFLSNGVAELSTSLQELKQLHPDKVFAVQEMELKERNAMLVRLEALPAESQESIEKFNREQIQLAETAYNLQTVAPSTYEQYTLEEYRTDRKLTQGERQRLEEVRNDLHAAWELRRKKLSYLQQELVIKADATMKFQLQHEIRYEEEEVASLNAKLTEIEQVLEGAI